MNAKELHGLTTDELMNRLGELKEELFNFRFRHAVDQLENPKAITKVKKEIARINTIIRERQIKAKA